jgi:hypothetical protein
MVLFIIHDDTVAMHDRRIAAVALSAPRVRTPQIFLFGALSRQPLLPLRVAGSIIPVQAPAHNATGVMPGCPLCPQRTHPPVYQFLLSLTLQLFLRVIM